MACCLRSRGCLRIWTKSFSFHSSGGVWCEGDFDGFDLAMVGGIGI